MDKTTLPEQLKTLRQRYGIEHCPVVGSQLNRLGNILHCLEVRERLTHQDIEWLKNRSLLSIKILYSYYTIEIAFAENEGQHEKENIQKYQSLLEDCRKAMEFDEVKAKYGIVCKQGVMNSVIYPLLSKIDNNIPLSPQERKKLKKRDLSLEQIMMGYLISTAQYYRREYENTKQEHYLLQAYAYQRKAKNTHETLQDAQRLQEIERLKEKYNVRCESSMNHMIHPILQKLQEQRRLTPDEFLWLHDQRMLSHVILNAYHQIEAIFFERQYQDTKDLWNLVNASSHWRKADEPQRALSTTANIQFETVAQPKLKSALLTTRGGAFRDFAQTRNATKCAIQAIECYPKTHQPYTLRGAICYDEGDYESGDHWFQEALQRGATPKDVDTELVSIVKKAKGEQRRKLIDHLLKKDPKVYEWLKRFTR